MRHWPIASWKKVFMKHLCVDSHVAVLCFLETPKRMDANVKFGSFQRRCTALANNIVECSVDCGN